MKSISALLALFLLVGTLGLSASHVSADQSAGSEYEEDIGFDPNQDTD